MKKSALFLGATGFLCGPCGTLPRTFSEHYLDYDRTNSQKDNSKDGGETKQVPQQSPLLIDWLDFITCRLPTTSPAPRRTWFEHGSQEGSG